MTRWHFHLWGGWSDIRDAEWNFASQIRFCLTCNKAQERYVK